MFNLHIKILKLSIVLRMFFIFSISRFEYSKEFQLKKKLVEVLIFLNKFFSSN